MSKNRAETGAVKRGMWKRLVSFALALALLSGFVPGLPDAAPRAEAAEWMESYLETLVDWGVMQGNSSGNLNPDRRLTRAEFVVMINRSFGYTEKGDMPFTDVPVNAWYADDFNIAYNAGYFTGSTATTADPTGYVTREQAAVLLGRNLRLQGISGVNSDFKDIQQIGNWSRGLVQECAELGIIQGYQDGTFRPKNIITRGQMACFLVRALGTLVHETGEQIAGGVYGNMTINTSGVKLKDTVVTGNLYISGGLGLGNIELENVTVMGKIVVCGAGEAEKGENSIVLRNVTAEGMEIDSLSDQFISVRSEGLTDIGSTTVRTSAYVEDVTDDGLGLRTITLDGEDGVRLQLAGNIKEVVNITPNSDLQVVQGVTDILTVDERAVGSALSIANETTVRTLNLDAGVAVTGNGDVTKMNINAAGATATMLPDTIYIRPGLNSNIHGEAMDSIAAEESSDDPKILSGYPLARNIASTSADAVFSANKRGTIYWAVSALLDGSLSEDELRNAAAGKGKVLRSGTINVTASKTEMTARVTGLSSEGSYYISAMLVDSRGKVSPVKVTAFTTTDESVPAFAAGYPEALVYVTENNEQIVQARVMTTKTCQLYYALLPSGSTAPSANDMRSGAIPGNLGYGVMSMRKNSPITIPRINTAYLQEKTTYDLYLWLNDADNNKSSAVRRLQVTTRDVTPPVLLRLEETSMTGTSITMTYSMDEPGTLYWAIVKRGVPFYAADIEEVGTPPSQANNEIAKMQIKRHLGVKGGSSNAARENTDVNFVISGLEPQTTYDLYYVVEDRDGNFNVYTATLTPPMQVNTLDEERPDVRQAFTHDGDANPQHPTPYTDTSIQLIFTEEVQGIDSTSNQDVSRFLELYEAGNTVGLATALAKHIRLYYKPALELPILLTAEDHEYGSIDFSKARVEIDTSDGETYGEMIITFPQEEGGLKLASGATYYFELEGIWDTARPRANQLRDVVRGIRTLPEFTTLFATVALTSTSQRTIDVVDYYTNATQQVTVSRSFMATPSGTDTVSEETVWDMLFWTDTSMTYTLFARERARRADDSGWDNWGSWYEAGTNSTVAANIVGAPDGRVFASMNGYIKGSDAATRVIPRLKDLNVQMEFAIRVDDVDANLDAEDIKMEIMVLAGDLNAIELLADQADHGWKDVVDRAMRDGAVQINIPIPFEITIPIPSKAPVINAPYPIITPEDIEGTIQVTLDRAGTVYYLAVPVNGATEVDGTDYYASGTAYTCDIPPQKLNNGQLQNIDLSTVPSSGRDLRLPEDGRKVTVDRPLVRTVSTGVTSDDDSGIDHGSLTMGPEVARTLPMQNLLPDQRYVLYLATQDSKGAWCEKVWVYQFHTKEAYLPIITIQRTGSLSATIGVNRTADITYVLVPTTSLTTTGGPFMEPFTNSALSTWGGSSNVTTVLDAMMEPTSGEDSPSVFDTYATPEAKLRFAALIRGMRTGTDANTDPVMVVTNDRFTKAVTESWATKDITMPSDKMTSRYTLLAVGRSANAGPENDAFRASQAYYNQDNTYLKVNSSSRLMGTMNAETFTGKVYVSFSNPLNYKFSVGSAEYQYPLDDCDKVKDTTHVGTNSVSAKGYKNVGSILTIVPLGENIPQLTLESLAGHDQGTAVLQFDAKNAGDGSTIILPAGICGPNGNVRSGRDLVLTLKRVTVQEYRPEVQAQPAITQTNPVTGEVTIISPAIPEQPAVYRWELEYDQAWLTDPN